MKKAYVSLTYLYNYYQEEDETDSEFQLRVQESVDKASSMMHPYYGLPNDVEVDYILTFMKK